MYELKNIWHSLSDDRVKEDDFIAVIEIPKGSKKKYEIDKETGYMILDRILYTSVQYPANYGFIPRTLSDDGDALDVLVLSSETIDSSTLVRCYPIGMVTMIDSGKGDEKIIAIPYGDPIYNEYKSIDMLPKHVSEELLHFLKIYKQLEDKVSEVKGISDVDEAKKTITKAKANYNKTFNHID